MRSDNLEPVDLEYRPGLFGGSSLTHSGIVPTWVHMAEVPPTVDDEPWPHGFSPRGPGAGTCRECGAPEGSDCAGEPHVTPVGGWLLACGAILAVLVFLAVTRPWEGRA